MNAKFPNIEINSKKFFLFSVLLFSCIPSPSLSKDPNDKLESFSFTKSDKKSSIGYYDSPFQRRERGKYLLRSQGFTKDSDRLEQCIFRYGSWYFENPDKDSKQRSSVELDKPFFAISNTLFDSSEWVNVTENRVRMLYDLVHRIPLIGMNRVDVRKLLGPPLKDLTVDPENLAKRDNDFYALSTRNFSTKAEHPTFEISYENGKVSAYRCIAESTKN